MARTAGRKVEVSVTQTWSGGPTADQMRLWLRDIPGRARIRCDVFHYDDTHTYTAKWEETR